jgi:hypothetical protein
MNQDEPVSKKKIRDAGFKKLANYSFKEKDYLAAVGSYSVVYIKASYNFYIVLLPCFI